MKKQANTLYIVVEVCSGVPLSAKLYHNKQAAKKHEKALRKAMHPENDETAIFEVKI